MGGREEGHVAGLGEGEIIGRWGGGQVADRMLGDE